MSCCKRYKNLWICLVIFSPSFIFNVCNLSFKNISVTAPFNSNIWINSNHVSFVVNFDYICEITLLSKQLLMIVSSRFLRSTQSLMLPTHVVGKTKVPIEI